MASAIDDSPVRVLVSLKRGWHSPLEAYTLCLAWYRASTSREGNANGHIYRTGRARVKLHARGAGAEWETTGVARGGANAQALIEVLHSIPGSRHLCLEEGTLASRLYEVLSPHVEEIVVTAVSKSRGPKSDKRDAFGLAERLRSGAIKRKVYKERGQFAALGHRAKAHWLLVGDSVRVMSRIKSLMRSRGVQVSGIAVYTCWAQVVRNRRN